MSHPRSLALAALAIAVATGLGPSLAESVRTVTRPAHMSLALGRKLFISVGCGACHTMKPAGTHGTMGPSLDQFTPPYGLVLTQITNGGGVMPAFRRRLTRTQIRDIATFVVHADIASVR